MTARISMADAKFSFQCPGRMYSPAWMAPEGTTHPSTILNPHFYLFPTQCVACTDRWNRPPANLLLFSQLCKRNPKTLIDDQQTCGALRCCYGSWSPERCPLLTSRTWRSAWRWVRMEIFFFFLPLAYAETFPLVLSSFLLRWPWKVCGQQSLLGFHLISVSWCGSAWTKTQPRDPSLTWLFQS